MIPQFVSARPVNGTAYIVAVVDENYKEVESTLCPDKTKARISATLLADYYRVSICEPAEKLLNL